MIGEKCQSPLQFSRPQWLPQSPAPWQSHRLCSHQVGVLTSFTQKSDLLIKHTVQNEDLKNLMMSWYYSGYYTGLYEGKQQGYALALQKGPEG